MSQVTASIFFRKAWLRFLPAIVGCLLYFGTSDHGFVLDDNLVLSQNVHVQEGASAIPNLLSTNYAHGHQGQAFNDGLYRPLSLVSFALEKSIYGLDPGFSHLVQALLYGMLLIGLMVWLQQLFGENDWVWWAVMLFAAHPLHTEVVANLKSRDELFALLFFAFSAWQYVRWLKLEDKSNLVFSGVLLLFALFSKESAITYIAVYPMMLWLKNEKASNRHWVQTALLVIPCLIFLLSRSLVLSQMGEVDSGVTGLLQNVLTTSDSLVERIATAGRIQLLYFEKLFAPFQLSSDYSYNAIPLSSLADLPALAGVLITATAIVLGTILLIKKRPEGFGIWFYFITISVVSNVLILIGAMAAERFTFSPSLGWSIALAAGVYHWKAISKFRSALLGGLTVSFMVLTAYRVPDWQDEYTLFTTDVERVENSARAHYNAGTASNNRAKKDTQNAKALRNDGVKHLKKAIAIWPDYQDAYNNLGVVYLDNGQLQEAYKVYKTLNERFPSYAKGLYNLGFTCYQLKRYKEAEAALEAYYAQRSSNDVLYLIAECEGYQKKFDEAKAHLQELIQKEPNKGRGYLKLGMAYAITNNIDQAAITLKKGSEVAPGNAELLFNLGLLYFNTKRYELAFDALQRCLVINPEYQRAKELMIQAQYFSAQTTQQ